MLCATYADTLKLVKNILAYVGVVLEADFGVYRCGFGVRFSKMQIVEELETRRISDALCR